MMDKCGLTKLIEECGELIQIAAKKSASMNTDIHPDGMGRLASRLEEEIADVLAAIGFVTFKLGLITDMYLRLHNVKLDQYVLWDKEES